MTGIKELSSLKKSWIQPTALTTFKSIIQFCWPTKWSKRHPKLWEEGVGKVSQQNRWCGDEHFVSYEVNRRPNLQVTGPTKNLLMEKSRICKTTETTLAENEAPDFKNDWEDKWHPMIGEQSTGIMKTFFKKLNNFLNQYIKPIYMTFIWIKISLLLSLLYMDLFIFFQIKQLII